MAVFEWCCPFCERFQIVSDSNHMSNLLPLRVGRTAHGNVGLSTTSIRCSNPECNEVYIEAKLNRIALKQGEFGHTIHDNVGEWKLRPEANIKTQPEYIPKQLVQDYREACLIVSKSPKAASTLARRCLQGMIRDFCNISENRLIDEIKKLRDQVDKGNAPKGVEPETIEAIDAVRAVGNIGAHMEKDISLIIDVDDGEAQKLIELIEMLFNEWYVARHRREEKLTRIKEIAAGKSSKTTELRAKAAEPKPALPRQSET